MTLVGSGSSVQLVSTTISLVRILNAHAEMRVDDEDVTCSAGQTVSTSRVDLECIRVDTGGVTLRTTIR